jgi:hypothetical protein
LIAELLNNNFVFLETASGVRLDGRAYRFLGGARIGPYVVYARKVGDTSGKFNIKITFFTEIFSCQIWQAIKD